MSNIALTEDILEKLLEGFFLSDNRKLYPFQAKKIVHIYNILCSEPVTAFTLAGLIPDLRTKFADRTVLTYKLRTIFDCDEMGLGKTVTSIILVIIIYLLKIAPFANVASSKKCMIIVPPTCVSSWLKKWDYWAQYSEVARPRTVYNNDVASIASDLQQTTHGANWVVLVSENQAVKVMHEFPQIIKDRIFAIVIDEGHQTPMAVLKLVVKTSESSVNFFDRYTYYGRYNGILDNFSLLRARINRI